jgi:hypothetical protein
MTAMSTTRNEVFEAFLNDIRSMKVHRLRKFGARFEGASLPAADLGEDR